MPGQSIQLDVYDTATGDALYQSELFQSTVLGLDPANLPPGGLVMRSSSSEGLSVVFQSFNSIDQLAIKMGFEASWRSVCSEPGSQLSGLPLPETFSDEVDIRISNTQFLGNSAGGSGGALFVSVEQSFSGSRRALVTMQDVTVQGNAAAGDGGGVSARSCTTVSLNGTALQRNVAGGRGAGLAVAGNTGPLTLTATTISGNVAGDSGGGVFVGDSTVVVVNGSSLSSNQASAGMGGAAAMENLQAAAFYGCTFASNLAATGGGGVFILNVTTAVFEDCAMASNNASLALQSQEAVAAAVVAGSGGAVLLTGPVLARPSQQVPSAIIRRTTFTANAAGGDGGAIAVIGACRVAIWDSDLCSNAALSGGALSASGAGAVARAFNSSLTLNRAGSMSQVPDALTLSLQSGGNGGALIVYPGARMVLSKCNVSACSAEGVGGALAVVAGGNCTVANSTVSRNVAGIAGGAAAVSGASSLALLSSTVTSNSAYIGGALGFAAGAETSASIAMSSLSFGGNTARYGNLYGTLASLPFSEPACLSCVEALGTAAGTRLATAPHGMTITAPAAVASGAPLALIFLLLDGFSQAIPEWSGTSATVAVPSQSLPAAAQAVPAPDSDASFVLQGSLRAAYVDGVASFAGLSLYGTPRYSYTLALTIALPGAAALAGSVNVTIAACKTLQARGGA